MARKNGQVRAAIYTRLSRDRTGEQTATARQERECRAFARTKSWKVLDVFEDVDTSAWSGARRPAFERLTVAIQAGEVDAVIVWKLDRLTRRLREFLDFDTLLKERCVALVSVTEGFDASTPMGGVLLNLLVSLAEMEANTRSVRNKAKHEELARDGKPNGGPRPFGYAADGITVVPEEADSIRDAAAQLLNGESLRSVTARWNVAGMRTSWGNKWEPKAVKGVLTSPRVAGLRELRGEVIGEAAWVPIIDVRTWRSVKVLLEDPTRRKNANTRGRYLLTGLLVCGACGDALLGQPQRGKASYTCLSDKPHPKGGKVRIMAAPLEETVARWADGMTLEAPRTVVDPAKLEKRLTKEIARAQTDLDDLARARYVDHVLDDSQFLAAQAPLKERMGELEARMAVMRAPAHNWSKFWDKIQSIPDTWEEFIGAPATAAEVRADLEAKVEKILVRPANRNKWLRVGDRVAITWRPGIIPRVSRVV